jgi:exosortase N
MIAANQNLNVKIDKTYYWILGLLLAGITGGAFAFPVSFLSNTNVLIGFFLFPIVFIDREHQRVNYLYLILMLCFCSIAWIYQVRMFYFLTLAFYILFVLEMFKGKINYLVLFLLVFMSPFFEQAAVVLGFPIRLFLSSCAGKILSFAGCLVKTEGNLIILNGTDFAVDEACMGLNMLSITMLMGVFVIGYQYITIKKKLGFSTLTLFFLFVFILNLLSNLFRIMTLVIFEILPANPLHEMIGILCLVVYVLIPIYISGKWVIAKYGKSIVRGETEAHSFSVPAKFSLVVLAIGVIWVGYHIRQSREQTVISHAHVNQIQHFQTVKMDKGITKIFSDQVLVYVKPIPEFFTGEHTPLLCWKGSGYKFKSVQKTFIGNHEIYTGVLSKSDKKLFTAWWYSNGEIQTINQFDWRLRMIKGEANFCLINVTASNETTLLKNVAEIFKNDLLKIHKNA